MNSPICLFFYCSSDKLLIVLLWHCRVDIKCLFTNIHVDMDVTFAMYLISVAVFIFICSKLGCEVHVNTILCFFLLNSHLFYFFLGVNVQSNLFPRTLGYTNVTQFFCSGVQTPIKEYPLVQPGALNKRSLHRLLINKSLMGVVVSDPWPWQHFPILSIISSS